MSDAELQEEEREVLLSIYDGDGAFKQLTPTTYQYKYGEDNDPKSFIIDISWGPTYPTEKPTISMNTFYNKHIVQSVKDKIAAHADAEAEQWLGCAMTYTIFQSVQEHLAELIEEQPTSFTELNSQTDKLTLSEDFQQLKKFVVGPRNLLPHFPPFSELPPQGRTPIKLGFLTEQSLRKDESSKKPKKEQLTKAQKRRQWNKADGKGDKPRGWDWVDIVKHLSQTGSKPDQET